MTSKALTLPTCREELPEIWGTTSDGRRIYASDLHGRKNIVLIFSGGQSHAPVRELVRALSVRYGEIQDEEAEIIVVEEDALDRAAICIADRYGEVYFSEFCSDTACTSADNVLEWLRFIESQCPECGVSEWPSAA
jgi:hypothetical protein